MYSLSTRKVGEKKMNKIEIIEKLRERDIKWKDISYAVDMTEAAAQMALKRKRDIDELVKSP